MQIPSYLTSDFDFKTVLFDNSTESVDKVFDDSK